MPGTEEFTRLIGVVGHQGLNGVTGKEGRKRLGFQKGMGLKARGRRKVSEKSILLEKYLKIVDRLNPLKHPLPHSIEG